MILLTFPVCCGKKTIIATFNSSSLGGLFGGGSGCFAFGRGHAGQLCGLAGGLFPLDVLKHVHEGVGFLSGAGDDVVAVQAVEALGEQGAGFHGGLASGHVTLADDANAQPVDLVRSDDFHFGGLGHGVGHLNGDDEAGGFDEAEGRFIFQTHRLLLTALGNLLEDGFSRARNDDLAHEEAAFGGGRGAGFDGGVDCGHVAGHEGIALAAESEGHADVKELHVGSLDGGIGRHHDGGGGEGFDDAERAAFRDARGAGEGADQIGRAHV